MSRHLHLVEVVERKEIIPGQKSWVEELLRCGHRVQGIGSTARRRHCGACQRGEAAHHAFTPDSRSPEYCRICSTRHLTGRGGEP